MSDDIMFIFHFEDPGETGGGSSSEASCESTEGPDAGKWKCSQPRKIVSTGGTELAAPRPLGKESGSMDASNWEISQVNSEAGWKNRTNLALFNNGLCSNGDLMATQRCLQQI
ncbi:hypothetical protein L208DRAFT_1383277 [Tricholoma matsutake]|nr:hypothetical protein L208DRAFT_1383277 [Tricholoma matsutake 945]